MKAITDLLPALYSCRHIQSFTMKPAYSLWMLSCYLISLDGVLFHVFKYVSQNFLYLKLSLGFSQMYSSKFVIVLIPAMTNNASLHIGFSFLWRKLENIAEIVLFTIWSKIFLLSGWLLLNSSAVWRMVQ